MEDLDAKLSHLKEIVRRTVAEIDLLRKEHAKIRDTHQHLVVENARLQLEATAMREELKTAKLAQALAGHNDQDPRNIKLQINSYLREIDKCLALLNRD